MINISESGEVTPFGQEGMSLRDWFAGQALAGAVADFRNGESEETTDGLAVSCYAYADAMLKARSAGRET